MTEPLLRVREYQETFPGRGAQRGAARGGTQASARAPGRERCRQVDHAQDPGRCPAPDAGQGTLSSTQELDRGDTPVRRQEVGVVTIYQEFNLLPAMSVAENMYLGRELRNT